ncbi:hypothetical protein BDV96DRAFT_240936 [Lophiotrema nucula]|uniref:Uncharacterized protein n=1 Tax=Lophiotrema nucula TaxID=690887 RepID=A0A6A5YRY0_9PLEO|nr:hypothetical protein BDV96DRAFT_240936 [Lophiotrema nucula]
MLPFEVFALISLASVSRAAVSPLQRRVLGNDTTTEAFVHQESTATGFGETSTTTGYASSYAAPVFGVSESGWENTTPTVPTSHQTSEFPPPFIVTETPSIIWAHTEIEASITKLDSTDEPTFEPTEAIFTPHTTQAGAPEPSSSKDLLHEIISRIHDPAPGATSQPAYPTDGSPYTVSGDEFRALPQMTSGLSAQATMVVGGSITLDGATLTLTPGLSTTFGTSGDLTYISLTTEVGGQTIIVLSSSGTEISATVTTAPVPLTLPKTGFDASQTAEARPGTLANSSSAGAAASTIAQKGTAAIVWKGGMNRWTCLTGGIFGLIVKL